MLSDEAFMIYRKVVKHMLGTYLTDVSLVNVYALERMVQDAGDGDHLEIGAYCGGSAVMVALLKREYKFTGKVVTVDPFNPEFYSKYNVSEMGFYPVPETVKYNARLFNVDIEVIQSNSDPLPVSGPFTSAYIDGDHETNAVMKDWCNVSQLVKRVIVLDDTWARGVKNVIEKAICSDWKIIDNELGVDKKVCLLKRK